MTYLLVKSEGPQFLSTKLVSRILLPTIALDGFFIVLSKLKYAGAQIGSPHLLSFLKLVFYYVGDLIPITLGSAPVSNWLAIILGFALFSTLIAVGLRRSQNPWGIYLGAIFIILNAFSLAIGRSQFEIPDTTLPIYPQDLIYSSTSIAWILIILGVVSKKFNNPKHGILYALSLCLILVLNISVFSAHKMTKIQSYVGGINAARQYKTSLMKIPLKGFAIDNQVSFVLPQFGQYAQLSSVNKVLRANAKIGLGDFPYLISPSGSLTRVQSWQPVDFVISKDTGYARDTGAFKNKQSYIRISGFQNVNNGDLVTITMQRNYAIRNGVTIMLVYSDGIFLSYDYQGQGSTIGLEVPKLFATRSTKDMSTLKAIQIIPKNFDNMIKLNQIKISTSTSS